MVDYVAVKELVLDLVEHSGLVDYCSKNRDGSYQVNGVKINKTEIDFNQKHAEIFYRISYLAKVNVMLQYILKNSIVLKSHQYFYHYNNLNKEYL